jgi:hypothetical protein
VPSVVFSHCYAGCLYADVIMLSVVVPFLGLKNCGNKMLQFYKS